MLGSLNMDLVVTVDQAPQPGQTVTGERFFLVPGGKGANQAVAASLAGAPVTMLGSVGDDLYAAQILDLLAAKGVLTDHVDRSELATGTAHIVVDGSGSNSIIVIPGANGSARKLSDRQRQIIADSRFLLLQLELPLALVTRAATYARECGVQVVLTPAPVQPLPDELLKSVDLLILNQGEALQLAGMSSIDAAIDALAESVREVIVTRGEQGCSYRGPAGPRDLEAFPVNAVDTTAAGDTFVGALSAQLAQGAAIGPAMRWASAAAAISVQRWGASTSMPLAAEVDGFLAERRGGAQ